MPHTDSVEEFLEKLGGDFYETVDGEVDGPMTARQTQLKQTLPQRRRLGASDVTNGVTPAAHSMSDSSDTLHSQSYDDIVGL